MKILFILPFTPFPLDNGGAQAVFSMIDNIRKSHSVSVLLQYAHQRDVNNLKVLWPDVQFYIFTKGSCKNWLPVKGRILSYLSSSFTRKYNRFFFKYWPEKPSGDEMLRFRTLLNLRQLPIDDDFYSYVKQISLKGFDIIQVEFNALLGLCYFLPDDTVKIFVHHEIEFIRKKNELELLFQATDTDKAKYEQSKDLELSMLRRYDHIVTLTANDKKILSRYMPEEKIHISPAVVRASKACQFIPSGFDFVFIGGADHFPNYDGISWLCEHVLPVLRSMHTEFKIYIIGSWRKKAIRFLSRYNKELVFPGFVKDLQKFVNGKISIVPIRIGSGMRMKILDAAWSSSPFITTSKGVEGQSFVDSIDCIIADTPSQFATAMYTLAKDADLQERLAGNAFKRINQACDNAVMLKIRTDIYDEIMMRNTPPQ